MDFLQTGIRQLQRLQKNLFNINANVHKVIRSFEGPSIFSGQVRKLVSVLFHLKKPCSLKTLCIINGITAPNGSAIADKLVKDGVITREPDPGDRRKVLISLAPEYRGILEEEHEDQMDHMAEAMSFLTEAELNEFMDAASTLNTYLLRIIEEHDLM